MQPVELVQVLELLPAGHNAWVIGGIHLVAANGHSRKEQIHFALGKINKCERNGAVIVRGVSVVVVFDVTVDKVPWLSHTNPVVVFLFSIARRECSARLSRLIGSDNSRCIL